LTKSSVRPSTYRHQIYGTQKWTTQSSWLSRNHNQTVAYSSRATTSAPEWDCCPFSLFAIASNIVLAISFPSPARPPQGGKRFLARDDSAFAGPHLLPGQPGITTCVYCEKAQHGTSRRNQPRLGGRRLRFEKLMHDSTVAEPSFDSPRRRGAKPILKFPVKDVSHQPSKVNIVSSRPGYDHPKKRLSSFSPAGAARGADPGKKGGNLAKNTGANYLFLTGVEKDALTIAPKTNVGRRIQYPTSPFHAGGRRLIQFFLGSTRKNERQLDYHHPQGKPALRSRRCRPQRSALDYFKNRSLELRPTYQPPKRCVKVRFMDCGGKL